MTCCQAYHWSHSGAFTLVNTAESAASVIAKFSLTNASYNFVLTIVPSFCLFNRNFPPNNPSVFSIFNSVSASLLTAGTRRFRVRGKTPEVNKVALTALKYFIARLPSVAKLFSSNSPPICVSEEANGTFATCGEENRSRLSGQVVKSYFISGLRKLHQLMKTVNCWKCFRGFSGSLLNCHAKLFQWSATTLKLVTTIIKWWVLANSVTQW